MEKSDKSYCERNIQKSRCHTSSQILVNQKPRKNVYFSLIRSYINFGNIAWGSASKTKFKKIFIYKKKTVRTIYFADQLTLAKPLMLDMHALNVYQINIYQNFVLVCKVHTGTAPSISFNKFSRSVIIIRK